MVMVNGRVQWAVVVRFRLNKQMKTFSMLLLAPVTLASELKTDEMLVVAWVIQSYGSFILLVSLSARIFFISIPIRHSRTLSLTLRSVVMKQRIIKTFSGYWPSKINMFVSFQKLFCYLPRSKTHRCIHSKRWDRKIVAISSKINHSL